MPPPRKPDENDAPVREESANTIVGQSLRHLLRQAGMNVAAEIVAEGAAPANRALPDIFIQAGKYRIVIEAKHQNPNAAARAAHARFSGMRPAPHIVGALSAHRSFRLPRFSSSSGKSQHCGSSQISAMSFGQTPVCRL